MKKWSFFLVLLVFSLVVKAQNNSIKQFSFLIGGWIMETPNGKITEYWRNEVDSLMGDSYSIGSSGERVLLETLIIKKINGDFYYCSKVREQNNNLTINFKLLPKNGDGNTFVFENLAHDFPQRVVYQNKGAERLLAWIEGVKNGKQKKSEFSYIRMK